MDLANRSMRVTRTVSPARTARSKRLRAGLSVTAPELFSAKTLQHP